MNRQRLACPLAALAFTSVLVSLSNDPGAQDRAEDWPQYLGPGRNGVAAAAIPAGARLKVAWRKKVPISYGSVAIAGNRLYTAGRSNVPWEEFLVAMDASRGTTIWRAKLGRDPVYGPFPPRNNTPAVAGDIVVAMDESCVLRAYRAASGDPVWEFNPAPDGTRIGQCYTPPIAAGNQIIVTVVTEANGPLVIALHAASGNTVWTSKRRTTAFDLQAGAVVWQIHRRGVPLRGDRVLVQTGDSSALYDTSSAPREIWTSEELKDYLSPPVLHGASLYGFREFFAGTFTCVDAATGTLRWSHPAGYGFTLIAGDTLVVLSVRSGLLRLVSPDPGEYRELNRLQISDPDRLYVAPAISGRRIYVRAYEEVVAVDAR